MGNGNLDIERVCFRKREHDLDLEMSGFCAGFLLMLISWRVMLASLKVRLLEMIPPVLRLRDVCIGSLHSIIFIFEINHG